MGARADLLAAAEGLAENARSAATPGDSTAPDFDRAANMAAAAKLALEAAALAENTGRSEIDGALDLIQELLAEAGVIDQSIEMQPPEFLELTFRSLIAWRREALGAAAHAEAYDGLRTLAENLERDFTAGGSEVSLRIAARIRNALDDATQTINQATGVAQDGQASGE